MKAIEELGRTGMTPDLSSVGRITDPVTGAAIDTGRGGALSGFGDEALSGTLANRNSIFNAVTGGGSGSAAGGAPGGDDARNAARSGKGRAASDDGESDGGVVTDTTRITPDIHYMDAKDGKMDGTVEFPGQGTRTIAAHEDGTVYVRWKTPYGTTITAYKKGEKPRGVYVDRPAPDDAGSSGGTMTAEQRRKAEQELRNLVDPSVNPGPEGGGGTIAGKAGSNRESLTDTDLAGQPVDDESSGGRGAPPPVGSITTDVGLAGQPVGDDPNFGTLNPGPGGSLGLGAGGFGSALVRGAAGTRVPTSVSDRVADDIGARLDPEN